MRVRRAQLAAHRTAQLRHAVACLQLQLRRAQAHRVHRQQGVLVQGVEVHCQLSQDLHSTRTLLNTYPLSFIVRVVKQFEKKLFQFQVKSS